jgi:branched-subunit amino acid transport protein
MEMLGFGPRTIFSALKLSNIFSGNHNEWKNYIGLKFKFSFR